MNKEINNLVEKIDNIENKLNVTISHLQGNRYANDMKTKKMLEDWLSILYKEFKKELEKTKKDIISEIKKEIKNGIKR